MANLLKIRFDPPISSRRFVETKDFKKLKETILKSDVVVVSGKLIVG